MDIRSRETLARISVRVCVSKWVIYPLLTFTLLVMFAASSQARVDVELKRGRLDVKADRASLSEILEAIAHRTGMEVQGAEELEEEVSVNFSGLPLREALQQLLAHMNYMLVENTSPKGKARAVLTVFVGSGRVRPFARKITSEKKPVLAEDEGVKDPPDPEDSEQAIREAMSDPNPTRQARALDLLAVRDGQNAIPALVKGTESKEAEVRFRALDILTNSEAHEQTILSALGKAVSDADVQVKSYAIRALAQRGGPETIGYLRQALRDPDSNVRSYAIDQIFRALPRAQGIPLLQEATADGNATVRSTASTLLQEATATNR